jgi:hypothetical protein
MPCPSHGGGDYDIWLHEEQLMKAGMPLIRDQITIEYAARLRTLARMLREELLPYRPTLISFTNGGGGRAKNVAEGGRGTDWGGSNNNAAAVLNACAGYIYFPHLCPSWNIKTNDARTKFLVEDCREGGRTNSWP